MTAHTKISGTWKDVASLQTKVAGSWKEVAEGYVKSSGTWEQFFAPVSGGTFELLETQVLASSAASVTFSSLSSYAADYQHLQIRMVTKNTSNDFSDNIFATVNGDTGANYAHHRLFGDGSAVSSIASTSQNSFVIGRYARSTGNDFASGVIDILDPFASTKNTTFRAFYGCFDATFVMLNSALYNNTAVLTSITFTAPFATGSRFSLYGIRGG